MVSGCLLLNKSMAVTGRYIQILLELVIRMKFVLFQDSLRLYLVNSPVVRAESLRFKRTGVFAVVS